MDPRSIDAEFEEFATARTSQLYRSAWLLCGEHAAAEDLVQETLARVYSRWRRVQAADNPAAYAQTVLFRLFVSARRRRSSTELPSASLPDGRAPVPDVDLRVVLVHALARLTPLDRAVLVLRYLHDQDVAAVARELGLSSQAVRNRASRALARVRRDLGADFPMITEGAVR